MYLKSLRPSRWFLFSTLTIANYYETEKWYDIFFCILPKSPSDFVDLHKITWVIWPMITYHWFSDNEITVEDFQITVEDLLEDLGSEKRRDAHPPRDPLVGVVEVGFGWFLLLHQSHGHYIKVIDTERKQIELTERKK